jgi:hypothetical protein
MASWAHFRGALFDMGRSIRYVLLVVGPVGGGGKTRHGIVNSSENSTGISSGPELQKITSE